MADLASGAVGAGNVEHLTFDESGGTKVVDASGNGKDATVVLGSTSGSSTSSSDAATADHFWTLTPLAWSPSAVYGEGDQVTYDGSVWRALWWTQSETPGNPTGAWEELITNPDGTAAWTASRVFTSGETATYDAQTYVAQWWTRNEAPGDPSGPWKLVG